MNVTLTSFKDHLYAQWSPEFSVTVTEGLGPYSLQELKDLLQNQPFTSVEIPDEELLGPDLKKGDEWDESKHPRIPAGQPGGGEFASSGDEPKSKRGQPIKIGDKVYSAFHNSTGTVTAITEDKTPVVDFAPEGKSPIELPVKGDHLTHVAESKPAVEEKPVGPALHPAQVVAQSKQQLGQGVTGDHKVGDAVFDWGRNSYGVITGIDHEQFTVSPSQKIGGEYKPVGQSWQMSHEQAEERLSHAGNRLTSEERGVLGLWFGSSDHINGEIEKRGDYQGKNTQLMLSAMSKLPPFEGRVFRAEGSGGPAATLQTGQVWSPSRFLSCTWKRGSYGKHLPYIYVIKSLTARDISGLSSALKSEREMIVIPRTRFKVLSVEHKRVKGYGIATRVFLKELKR